MSTDRIKHFILENTDLLTIVALGLVAIALRSICLTEQALSLDEAYTVLVASGGLMEIIKFVPLDPNPPFAFIFYKLWISVFGNTPLMIELPAALFGVCSVWLIGYLAFQLFDRTTGYIAAGLLALSSYHLLFSQYVRTYSLALMLILASAVFLHRLKQSGGKTNFCAFVLCSLLALNTHYFAIFVILAFFLAALLDKQSTLPRSTLSKAGISITLLYLPTLYALIHHYRSEQSFHWIPSPSLEEFASGWYQMASSSVELLIIFLSLLCCLLWAQRASLRNDGNLQLLLLWLLLPIILPLVISLSGKSFFHVRFFLFALPAFLLLVAFAITKLTPIAFFVAMSVIAIFSVPALSNYYAKATKPTAVETLLTHIQTQLEPSDVLLHSNKCSYSSALYYLPEIRSYIAKDATKANILHYWTPDAFVNVEQVQDIKRFWFLAAPCYPDAARTDFIRRAALGERVKTIKNLPGGGIAMLLEQ